MQGDYPDISQEHAKAAALRHVLPWVALRALGRSGRSEVATWRSRLLSELAALDAVYTRQPRFLSRAQALEAEAHCTRALRALVHLTKLQPHGPWRMAPKAHALWHIGAHTAMGNPRVTHCYQEEDFMGRCKRLYQACHGASAPHRAVQRYCMGTCIALTAREELIAGVRPAKRPRLQGGPQRSTMAAAAAASSTAAAWPGLARGRGRPPMHRVKRPRGRPSMPWGA